MPLTITVRPGEFIQIGDDTLHIVKRGNNTLTVEMQGQQHLITARDWVALNPLARVRVGVPNSGNRPPRLLVETEGLNVTLPKKDGKQPVLA